MPSLPPPGPVRIHPPARDAGPVVFDSPHSGFALPADFDTIAPEAALRSTCDAYVDGLWSGVTAYGATLLAATFPRCYIDANRAAGDIDPELLATPWPQPLQLTDYTRRGMGLIRRFALPGIPMYEKRLSVEDVQHRIDTYYTPYRTALRGTLESAVVRHGLVWHFNCHSMKSRGNAMNVDAGARRPDFVISDRDGTSAVPGVTRWTAEFFRGLGYSVQVNDPYHGGDIVRSFGAPDRHRSSIQIEISRGLYMNEADFARNAGFEKLRDHLTAFAAAACARVATLGADGLG